MTARIVFAARRGAIHAIYTRPTNEKEGSAIIKRNEGSKWKQVIIILESD